MVGRGGEVELQLAVARGIHRDISILITGDIHSRIEILMSKIQGVHLKSEKKIWIPTCTVLAVF